MANQDTSLQVTAKYSVSICVEETVTYTFQGDSEHPPQFRFGDRPDFTGAAARNRIDSPPIVGPAKNLARK